MLCDVAFGFLFNIELCVPTLAALTVLPDFQF